MRRKVETRICIKVQSLFIDNNFLRCVAFHILGTGVSSSLSNAYDPDLSACVTRYGPSQMGWNLPTAGSAVFSKTFLRTRSPSWNARGFTHLLWELARRRW